MTTMTVSLPAPMQDWVDVQVETGAFADASDYIRDLIRRDRERRDQDMTLDELRQVVRDARASGASGASERSVGEIYAEARDIARARGTLRA